MGNSLCRFKVSPNPPEKSKRGRHQSLNVAPLNHWFQTRRMSQMEVVKNKKGAIRVKVVLSKEEAAQLLTLCACHKESMAIKTVHRLGMLQTPGRRQSYCQWRPVLASIPELI
ncbi:hypothetical protein ZIOFF_045276 [Zingiber officinale]|uniref:Uncharacterized protein n=1 Tax=Zingiber officinale TaxID=94328 RepID=A0A8J5G2S1_ZINOF|nr:hypothetical protein ZIOFF_045276 [Zingiber officinale]